MRITRFSRRLPSGTGFTLVELLVVVGIIAVLIGILLPSLNKARQSANKAACLSNQRQILLALTMYVNDTKGVLPGPIEPAVNDPRITNPVAGGPVVSGNTVSLLSTYGAIDYSGKELSSLTLLQRYVGGADNWKVWMCPGAKDMFDNATVYGGQYVNRKLGFGYLMNSSSQTSSSTPSFLFGYYGSYTNPTASQIYSTQPKRVNQIKAVYGPSGATVTDSVASKIWLITDVDGRNWSDNLSATFGIAHDAGTTYDLIAQRPWQPVHSPSLHLSGSQRGLLGRNYGYLDGHAQYLSYYDWPNNGTLEQ